MSKLVLADLTNLQNESTAVNTINNNNTLIEIALENTLSRDGTSPNTMSADLDMNSNNIINLPAPASATEPWRKQDHDAFIAEYDFTALQAAVQAAEDAQTAAEAAQQAAELAKTNAETAETNAETAETNAETAEANAELAQQAAEAAQVLAEAAALTAQNNATVVAGDRYIFEASTTMAEPAVGGFRFNHATPSSATAIAVHAQNALTGNPDVSDWIASWDDSTNPTNKANLIIRELGTPSNGLKAYITSVVDNTTWLQINITGATDLGSPAWTAGDAASFQVGIIGDAGSMTGPVSSTGDAIARFDGTGGTAVQDSGVIIDDSNNVTGMTTLTLPNTGLHLLDTNASHDLIIAPGSNLTADRTLTLTTGDANRTLTISGNATVSQDYSTTGNPQFATIELGHASDTTLARSAAGKVTIEGKLIAAIADPGADRVLIWDDSAGDYVGATLNSGLQISGTTIRAIETHGIALSDETTAITTGTNKATFSLPYAFTVTGVYATLNTASSSGVVTVDINEAGTTILSTKLTIDANEKTSGTAATAAVISDASIAANAEIGFDIDGAGTGAKGLKVFIQGYRT